MKDKEMISTWQMIVLFQAFITGSSIINIQGLFISIAQNGAWISLLLANVLGFIILTIVLWLNKKYPDLSYIEYTKRLLGKGGGYLFGIALALLLFQITSNITHGMGQFFSTSMMKHTPLYVFHFLILFVAALTVKSGIEVMARMFHGLLYLILFIISFIILLNFTHFNPEYLLPVLPMGWKPIWHGVYVGFGFPYMDVMYFAMLLPYLAHNSDKPFKRWMYVGLLLNGLILATTIVACIMILGPMALTEKFPIFQIARMIEIGEIIQRVESVFGMALIVASFMKLTMMLFIINEVVTQVFGVKDKRTMVFPNTLLVYLLSLTMYHNEIELGESGLIMETILAFSLAFVPLLIVAIRSLFVKENRGHT